MKSLNTVIREMHNKVEETVDLDESTKAYAASLEKMASDKKLKNISKKDRDILAKLADMMKNANEEVELDEDALNEAVESIQLEEDYFKVQYFGKDGKPEAGKESSFKDEKSAKRYLARAQKAAKVGEYKLTKEKGKLESVEGLDENVGKKVYEKKVGQSTVKVFKYSNGMHFAFFTSKGFGETNVQIKKLDKGVLNKAVKHFDDNKGLLGSSLDSIYEEIAEGLNKPLADKIGKLTKLRDSMKGAESREVGRLLVQLRKGESDRVKGILGGMGKKTQSAVAKIMGEELESIQESNVFGHSANHGISDSLLAAVNRVVVGQDETLEPEVETQNEIIENGAADLAENVGKKAYTKKVGKSSVTVYQYPGNKMYAFFTSKGYGETNYAIKKLDKKVIDAAVKHFDDNKGLLGSSLDSIYEEIAEGVNKPLAAKIGKLTKLRDSMKGAESREVGRLLVQLRKGESDRVKGILGGMGKKTQSAVAKIMGEELESIQESNVFGHSANHGITDSLLAAVNRVVTGEADAVEPEVADQNEIIEAGAEELGEAAIKDVQGKDGKKYAIELQKNGRKVAVRTKNQFGDIATIDLKKAAKIFEQDVLDKLVEDNTNDDSDDGEGLDKVQPKAVKKKFKDRKDKDIDNDGDVDDSDKFLHKKRKAISKAVNEEDSETDDEPKEKEDKKDKKKGAESVDVKPKLDEAAFKAKYGSRWEVVLEATANKLAMKNTK